MKHDVSSILVGIVEKGFRQPEKGSYGYPSNWHASFQAAEIHETWI